MEYMAAELPVIATNAGGTPELVKDNISGFLVPTFDENVVAEKILYLFHNQNKAKEMGKAGRKIIEKDFSQEKMVNSYKRLYEKYAT
jgi:glycosyltransferase involved in cell wall biosynthesis